MSRFFAKANVMMAAGLFLVVAVSFMEGVVPAFFDAIRHVINDITIELPVHAYIAGFVLVVIGITTIIKKKSQQKKLLSNLFPL